VLIALLIILLAVLICSFFVQIISRKRKVDYLLPQLNKQMVERNKQIVKFLNESGFKDAEQLHYISKIKQLLNQVINDDIDLVELIAIEDNFDKHYNALLMSCNNNEEMEYFFESRLLANLKFNQKTLEFNSAVTYHNNSVNYFPTKLFAQLLGYKTVPLLKTNNIDDFKQWKATYLQTVEQTT